MAAKDEQKKRLLKQQLKTVSNAAKKGRRYATGDVKADPVVVGRVDAENAMTQLELIRVSAAVVAEVVDNVIYNYCCNSYRDSHEALTLNGVDRGVTNTLTIASINKSITES